MLTEVKAYSSWASAPVLELKDGALPESDYIQCRNIDGIDPVKAVVTKTPFGAVDGVAYTGSVVNERNIVLTLHPNPDWVAWTYESLRRLIYQYFMPKLGVKLEFYSDDITPVEILGIVESCEVNPFSKDPEMLVSIICPDPYFTAIQPKVLTGLSTTRSARDVEYAGTIEAGVTVQVTWNSDPQPTFIGVQIGDPTQTYFNVATGVDASKYFLMNSVPRNKFVQTVNLSNGVIGNLLSKVQEGSEWPTLKPGSNDFSILSDVGVQDWTLTYYERFGGL